MAENQNRYLVNASWLILLRWVAAIGQLLTITVSALVTQIPLPYWPLLIVIGVTVGTNLVLAIWFRAFRSDENQTMSQPKWDLLLGLVLALDMISLTVLLVVTGGINNPFCLFFFVNLSLAAVILSRNWAWALNVFSIFCFGLLLFYFWPIDQAGFGNALQPVSKLGAATLQHFGLLVAFATCSSVITYFMTRLTDSLRRQELDLRLAQSAQARSEKLEALGTLAAGAAHELASPLSTIAIVAKDLESMVIPNETNSTSSTASNSGNSLDFDNDDLVNDVKLIRSQVDRCRKILDRMAGHAGQTVGETMQNLSASELWELVIDGLEEPDRVNSVVDSDAQMREINVPVDALGQSLRGLVQNAIDVQPAGSLVQARISLAKNLNRPDGVKQGIMVQIIDQGDGMDENTLQRVSEPFFTTKPPGTGMGLGVFLAQNVIERLGGQIEFESKPGEGTTVTVIF